MHFSTILALASAFAAQGALAAQVLVYTGRDCTGDVRDIHVSDNSCTNAGIRFISYKENGWGGHNQRLSFNTNVCRTREEEDYLYDTWAYNGDYFQSKRCYNLADYPGGAPDWSANSIRSYFST